jgi:hypothetical protein
MSEHELKNLMARYKISADAENKPERVAAVMKQVGSDTAGKEASDPAYQNWLKRLKIED